MTLSNQRRCYIFGLLFFGVCAKSRANLSQKLAEKIIANLMRMGKPANALITSAAAGVLSVEAMKKIDHANEDSPTLLVVTYYTSLSQHNFPVATTCWHSPPKEYFDVIGDIEKITINDIKEINKNTTDAAVFIQIFQKFKGKQGKVLSGPIYLRWINSRWLITKISLNFA